MIPGMDWMEIGRGLSSEQKWQLDQHAQTMELRRGDFVYRQGEAPRGLYFVKSGLVGLVVTAAGSGKEHLLRFFRQGQFFGHRALFSQDGYHGTTVALEPTTVKWIPGDVFLRFLDIHPFLYKEILVVVARELKTCETQHVMILENQILGRVAQSLVYLKDLHPEHNWTRQEIANFCASTVSTVIKTLTQLEEMGLIAQNGRSIDLLNRDALVNLQD